MQGWESELGNEAKNPTIMDIYVSGTFIRQIGFDYCPVKQNNSISWMISIWEIPFQNMFSKSRPQKANKLKNAIFSIIPIVIEPL